MQIQDLVKEGLPGPVLHIKNAVSDGFQISKFHGEFLFFLQIRAVFCPYWSALVGPDHHSAKSHLSA
jgi:hypothetical protein